MMDIITKIDTDNKVTYYYLDTGVDYQATKDHLDYLEKKYNKKILRVKPDKSIPKCCVEYGVPFLSKSVSHIIDLLQRHNFNWKDEPYEEQLLKYPKCISGIKWWHNKYGSLGVPSASVFNVARNKWLKEFLIQNPPDFKISKKCCDYAKKKPAKRIIKELNADLDITGIRKSEGGLRGTSYKNCYSKDKAKGCNTYRPLFWFNDKDKNEYEVYFNIVHSKCYTEYGMKRTGCTGCPYNRELEKDLEIIKEYEPKFYKAANYIFGRSYEYTKKFKEFQKMMNKKENKC